LDVIHINRSIGAFLDYVQKNFKVVQHLLKIVLVLFITYQFANGIPVIAAEESHSRCAHCPHWLFLLMGKVHQFSDLCNAINGAHYNL
jgi:hypothetical protein